MPSRRYFFVILCALFAIVVVAVALTSSGRARTTTSGGLELFEKRCAGCHAMDREKEGPRLRGVYGRMAGSIASFPYSEALKNSKILWNAETLDRWLIDPEKMVSGTDMAFHVENPKERRDIIAYLKESSGK